MARFELKLPKMGESVEATITNWLKSVGDSVEMDEAMYPEIATDKVDSEVPPLKFRGFWWNSYLLSMTWLRLGVFWPLSKPKRLMTQQATKSLQW